MILIDPTLLKAVAKFRANRRATLSLLVLATALILSLFGEAWCNDRPYVVRYGGSFYFPILFRYPAETFGETVRAEADYKALSRTETFRASGDWMLFAPIPFGQNESVSGDSPPPHAPSRTSLFGTDDRGRDLLTRLIFGFRNSMLFALASWVFVAAVAFVVGATQGVFGGRYDLIVGRLTEIWSALPVLYVILFLLSVFPASLVLLTAIWVVFSWIGLSTYIRAEALRVRKQEFITAARALGFSWPRIVFRHVLPNTLTPIVTFSPFLISAAVGSLAALDYLGLGLPPPAASWGELLRQGKENLRCWWLVSFPFASLFLTLTLLNFVGEGVRSAFDAKGA